MAFPKVEDWGDAVTNAGTRGFNPLVDFEREVHRVYPDLRPFTFCFASEGDMNNNQIIGWRPMMGSHFDVDDFTKTFGLRFGVRLDASDMVRLGENYVLLMPKKHREIILQERKSADDNMKSRAQDAQSYVHPNDPEYNKMKDAAKKIAEAGSETYKLQIKGTPEGGSGGEKADEKPDEVW